MPSHNTQGPHRLEGETGGTMAPQIETAAAEHGEGSARNRGGRVGASQPAGLGLVGRFP